MRQKLAHFMEGRYGLDQLGRVINIVACVCAVISLLGTKTVLRYFWYPAVILLIYSYFRTFSRNVYKRQEENRFFLEKTEGIRRRVHLHRNRFSQRQDYRFYACPSCKTTVRVPKGKGTINITCPKCREKFTRKS